LIFIIKKFGVTKVPRVLRVKLNNLGANVKRNLIEQSPPLPPASLKLRGTGSPRRGFFILMPVAGFQ